MVTDRMDGSRLAGAVCLVVALVGGAVLAVSNGWAQGGAATATDPDASTGMATETVVPPRYRLDDESIRLRSSVTLGKPRPPARMRRAEMTTSPDRNPVATGGPTEPGLQRSVTATVPSSDLPMKQILPGGELNREGIVPASRARVRDGTIVLEGDRKTKGESAVTLQAPVVAPSANHSAAAAAGDLPVPVRGEQGLAVPADR